MRPKMVMGNWKMNGSLQSVESLVLALLEDLPIPLQSKCTIFPPAIYLPRIQTLLRDSGIQLGAQNVYPEASGAYTGEISGPMLRDFNCQLVLVGHSERRHLFGEDEKFVAKKFHHVKDHDMIPVLCLGETLEQREQGLTEQVIECQLEAVVHDRIDVFDRCVIAYEPVWAIGTGKTASVEQVQAAHAFIRKVMTEYDPTHSERVPILYGGSVNEHNASTLFSMPDVDGGLVGGASLNARQFVEIVKCIS